MPPHPQSRGTYLYISVGVFSKCCQRCSFYRDVFLVSVFSYPEIGELTPRGCGNKASPLCLCPCVCPCVSLFVRLCLRLCLYLKASVSTYLISDSRACVKAVPWSFSRFFPQMCLFLCWFTHVFFRFTCFYSGVPLFRLVLLALTRFPHFFPFDSLSVTDTKLDGLYYCDP